VTGQHKNWRCYWFCRSQVGYSLWCWAA